MIGNSQSAAAERERDATSDDSMEVVEEGPTGHVDQSLQTPNGRTRTMDATPTPREAARRLNRFKADVQQKRSSPILASPPKQTAPAKRSLIKSRSARIAAQPLAHIPASKRGEALLQKKMGIQTPAPQYTPASQSTYDAIRSGELSDSQIAAFDELFPAAQYKAVLATVVAA